MFYCCPVPVNKGTVHLPLTRGTGSHVIPKSVRLTRAGPARAIGYVWTALQRRALENLDLAQPDDTCDSRKKEAGTNSSW